MLTPTQMKEIKEHLQRAQNPIFLYDNDADGLCSFLLLRRFLGRGKGVAIRSYPDLNLQYAEKVKELKGDYVFILDKPLTSRAFVEELGTMHIPIVWIDHHSVSLDTFSNEFSHVHTYNPARNEGKEKSDEPVTYWAYELTKRKEDMWIAIMGCIADHFMPPFAEEFGKKYPELWGKVKVPFDVYYKTEIGKIARALNFGIKDSTSHIVELQEFLIKCKGPEEVFSEVEGNGSFRKRYEEIRKKYKSFMLKAQECLDGKVLFFSYGGDMSISADLANELYYNNPGIYVAVAYVKGTIANISMRGKGVRNILELIKKEIPEAIGGGHDDAVGSRVKSEYLPKFKELLVKAVE